MNALALISMGGLVPLLIHVIVAALVFWLVIWAIGYIGIPEPFAKVIKVILVLMVLIFLLNAVLSLDGHAFIGP